MICTSTRGNAAPASFRDALFRGQAPDGGLYMPQDLPTLTTADLDSLARQSYPELAYELGRRMLGDEIDDAGTAAIAQSAYSFAPQLHELRNDLHVLELFHGPTCSFKDFGAQFMAKAMGYFARDGSRPLTILVATSGDTGSAVAHAYHHVEGIRIVLLYPSGKVSPLQEKQFTTLGDNVQAIEVQGTFDDCQAMVKQAFADEELSVRVRLSSANSINIGRLIPQSFYYVWSVAQRRRDRSNSVMVCVPSGNFGNLTAGFFAKRMGVPIEMFVAAVNANAVIPEYLETGTYRPRPSIRTYSNAMDVGAPSNWERIRSLYEDDYERIKAVLWSTSVDDECTVIRMQQTFERYHYIADPHTAVGLEAVERIRRQVPRTAESAFISLSTAHPAKFNEVVELALGKPADLPQPLQEVMTKEKNALPMGNRYTHLKEYLWHTN
ncbi:MAG: threonine synthase [Fimbriimonadales bacterium]